MLDLPEPESVRSVRALERDRDHELSKHGPPSAALTAWPALAEELAALRTAGSGVTFSKIAKYVSLPKTLSIAQFEWLPDEWSAFGEAGLEPTFYPLAGADGDYLGLVLDAELLSHGVPAPLVYYFHENDPIYSWVFESCACAAQVVRLAETKGRKDQSLRGTEHPAVTAFLREMNDVGAAEGVTPRLQSRRWLWGEPADDEVALVFERAGNLFAARNVAAQRIWRDYEEKIQSLRP